MPTPSVLRRVVLGILLAVIVAPAPASAQSGSGSGLKVTIAARTCDRYTDIFANRARNDIMESLKDLGPDTPYVAGQPISPAKEDLAPQSRCHPLPDWTFALGTGYQTRAVSGVWGSLSIVTNPFSSPSIVTKDSTALLDNAGLPTGDTIKGATTIELTQSQANLAAEANRLWLQGGTPTDPILFQQYPNEYGFGALRCAIDNLNGDNVEWISFPSGSKHVFCYAYYVKPPPTSGTIIVRKEVDAPAGTARTDFRFTGNISFSADESFTLGAAPGAPGSTTFYRAEVTGLTPEWTFAEQVPNGWTLTSISCTSATGASTTTTNVTTAGTSVRLAAGDTVTCTYTDRLTPPPAGLAINKVTSGGVGAFSWDVTPAGGGAANHVTATTTKEDVSVLGAPLLSLEQGPYAIQEALPQSPNGTWRLDRAQCNGADVAQTQPVNITLTAGQGAFCTFFNAFTPNGTIRLHKRTVGGVGTAGFVITPVFDKTRSYEQSATTTKENVPVLAKGDDTSALKLGRYVIQETTPSESTTGYWAIDSVTCDGVPVGSGQGRIAINLTATDPDADCTFTNRFTKGPEPPTPTPTPEPAPEPGGGVSPVGPSSRPAADLVLAKRAIPGSVRLGRPVRFVLTLKNRGPDTAQNVTAVEVGPPSKRALTVSSSKGSCRTARPVVCRIGSLRKGEVVVLGARVTFPRAGSYINTAAANTSTFDPLTVNNDARARARVRPVPRFTG